MEAKVEKRLKVLNDFAFKKALGEKGDEKQLTAFLDAVLERTGKGNLKSIEILEGRDLSAERLDKKEGKLDVLAELHNGTKVNIEVQRRKEIDFEMRSLFYWSKIYSNNIEKGEGYDALAPVISINILDFKFNKVDDFHTSFHLYEDRNKDVLLTDVCELHFIDLPKFKQSENYDLNNPLHRWLVYFNDDSPEELVEEVLKMDENIRLVQDRMDTIARSDELRRAYDQYEKAELDYISGIRAAEKKARTEGRVEGMVKGRVEGIAEGMVKGRTEGIAEGMVKGRTEGVAGVARKAILKGVPLDMVKELTGLDEETIRSL
jgi:predicted transposase/invertase (TIGR01784 family)